MTVARQAVHSGTATRVGIGMHILSLIIVMMRGEEEEDFTFLSITIESVNAIGSVHCFKTVQNVFQGPLKRLNFLNTQISRLIKFGFDKM